METRKKYVFSSLKISVTGTRLPFYRLQSKMKETPSKKKKRFRNYLDGDTECHVHKKYANSWHQKSIILRVSRLWIWAVGL